MTRSDAVCVGAVWQGQGGDTVKILRTIPIGKRVEYVTFCRTGETQERTLDRRAFLAFYTVRNVPQAITPETVFDVKPTVAPRYTPQWV